MEALKQRLSALKANAAADGGADNIVKVTAWKEWKEAKGMDVCDLLQWALGTLDDTTDTQKFDGLTLCHGPCP